MNVWSDQTTSTTTDNGAWYNWNYEYSTSDTDCTMTTVNDSTWSCWTQQSVEITRFGDVIPSPFYSWVERQEETFKDEREKHLVERKRERERLAAERKRERTRIERVKKAEEYRQKRAKAEDKAVQLLEDLIGEEQTKIYKETGRLLVKGRKHDYLLEKGRSVRQLKKDTVVDFCIHLENQTKFPETDNIIGLKLLIEDDEKQFHKTANRISEHPRSPLPKCANG